MIDGIYVVHVFPTRERKRFYGWREAFHYWRAKRLIHRGVAMWSLEQDGTWFRLYATEGYPERLTRPW
jgi:hypothetical protein